MCFAGNRSGFFAVMVVGLTKSYCIFVPARGFSICLRQSIYRTIYVEIIYGLVCKVISS